MACLIDGLLIADGHSSSCNFGLTSETLCSELEQSYKDPSSKNVLFARFKKVSVRFAFESEPDCSEPFATKGQ